MDGTAESKLPGQAAGLEHRADEERVHPHAGRGLRRREEAERFGGERCVDVAGDDGRPRDLVSAGHCVEQGTGVGQAPGFDELLHKGVGLDGLHGNAGGHESGERVLGSAKRPPELGGGRRVRGGGEGPPPEHGFGLRRAAIDEEMWNWRALLQIVQNKGLVKTNIEFELESYQN